MDPATLEIARGAEVVRLEPKAMEVLVALAGRPGEVVSRETLFAEVWPGVVVGDEALTQSIAKLRRALGDDPREPRYIETIAKRGYRLKAPVRASDDAVEAPARPKRTQRVAAAVAVAAVAGLVAWLSQDRFVDERRVAAEPESRGGTPTVTVLPFETIGEGDQAYLARGIGNDLATDLARLPQVRVIRPSTGAKAAARFLVGGSVQRAGDTLRVNVHLTDAGTGRQLWSERFERPYADLFRVQDEILSQVTARLPAKLAEAVRQRNAGRYTRSLEAYDWFLRGQALFLVRQPLENDAAREPYRKAIEIDPKFARAYAGLAMTYAMDPRLQPGADPAPSLARALELAESARGIDPDIPEVHWALGFIHAQARRHDDALRELERAVSLDPSFADAYALMGGVRTYVGDPKATIPLVRTALRLDPDGGYLYYTLLGRAYFFTGDAEQALINLKEAAARNPVDLETRVYMAAAMVAAGDRAGAEWQAQEIRALAPGFSIAGWLRTYPLADPALRARLGDGLRTAGLPA